MKHWSGEIINVVSVGATSHLQLCGEATEALQMADVIIGAEHQFEKLPSELTLSAERVDYPRPWSGLGLTLERYQTQKIVLLASGDALFFGVGSWLIKNLGDKNCRFFSNISSVQAAFALLNKPWESAETISLHGRPLTGLRSRIRRNRLYGILTDTHNTPTVLAAELLSLGFENAKIWVVEAINDPAQRIRSYTPAQLASESNAFHTLNVCVLESGGGNTVYPDFPGLDDSLFSNTNSETVSASGMFTKREVRLAILSLIQPSAGELGWDVGAGFGSVSIEWARWQPLAKIHAVENHPTRFDVLIHNLEKFGVKDRVFAYKGHAPATLQDLPTPNVVYIGGSQGGIESLLDYCWQRLHEHGRLVVSAVTEMTKASLIQHVQAQYASQYKIDWTEIAVSKGSSLADQLLLQPRLPVLLLCMHKQAK